MNSEQIKLKWQEHNRGNGLTWNEIAELVNEVQIYKPVDEPKQNGVIRNDRIVDKNIHPSTEKESGMSAEEWSKTYMIGDEFSTDQNWSMFFRYADEYHKFASTGREYEKER